MRQALKVVGTTLAGAALLAILALGPAHAQTDVQVDWIRRYTSGNNPEFAFAYAVAVDVSGSVYVTGSSYGSNGLNDFATVKYSSSGDTLWVQRYNGPADNWDAAWDLALDASGNVYVTGESYSSDFFDYVTIKYSPSGTQEWVGQGAGTCEAAVPRRDSGRGTPRTRGLIKEAAGLRLAGPSSAPRPPRELSPA